MLEGEIFDTTNSVSQNKGNADMGESQNPKMDVSKHGFSKKDFFKHPFLNN
jgi:hypothetical protein